MLVVAGVVRVVVTVVVVSREDDRWNILTVKDAGCDIQKRIILIIHHPLCVHGLIDLTRFPRTL